MSSATCSNKGYFCGRRGIRLVLGILLAAGPLAAATARIYVANRGGTTIDVIDPATNKVVEVIKGIESPEVVRFSPDGSRLYITSRSEDVLDVRDRKSGKVIKKVPLSGWANDAMVTSDGKLIVICIRNTSTEAVDVGALDIIDAKSLEKVKSIPVKRGLHDVSLTGDGKFAAAGSPGGQFITVFDLQKMEIAWEVQYDQGVLPVIVESNPDGSGHRIFAQLNRTNGFSVVDFATHKEVARIKNPEDPTGFPQGAKESATASVSLRTIKLFGPTAGRATLFLFTHSPISSFWDMSPCLKPRFQEKRPGAVDPRGSHSLPTARPSTFPRAGPSRLPRSMCRR